MWCAVDMKSNSSLYDSLIELRLKPTSSWISSLSLSCKNSWHIELLNRIAVFINNLKEVSLYFLIVISHIYVKNIVASIEAVIEHSIVFMLIQPGWLVGNKKTQKRS